MKNGLFKKLGMGTAVALAAMFIWGFGFNAPSEAKDAAAVLEKLEDQEISAILFHLSDRKAADILGKFSSERAATLSRSVLGSRSGNGS